MYFYEDGYKGTDISVKVINLKVKNILFRASVHVHVQVLFSNMKDQNSTQVQTVTYIFNLILEPELLYLGYPISWSHKEDDFISQ